MRMLVNQIEWLQNFSFISFQIGTTMLYTLTFSRTIDANLFEKPFGKFIKKDREIFNIS